MSGKIDAQLAELNIELPEAAAPVGNYVPFVISGTMAYISGQLPAWNGELRHVGKLGEGLDVEDGYNAARICALNVLAQLRESCSGDLDRVLQVVKLGGFVNCTTDFNDAPKCVNGASDLMVEVFGEKIGPHARFAVGVASLPSGVAVEVDGIFEIS